MPPSTDLDTDGQLGTVERSGEAVHRPSERGGIETVSAGQRPGVALISGRSRPSLMRAPTRHTAWITATQILDSNA